MGYDNNPKIARFHTCRLRSFDGLVPQATRQWDRSSWRPKGNHMRYDEFRDQLQDALHAAGLFVEHVDRPIETIDLASTDRRWKVYVMRDAPESVEPFHVSAKISFRWSAANGARGHTCEEDLLTELLGRRIRLPKTQRRWTRVDLELYATLPYGSTAPIPKPQVFNSWTGSVGEKLDKLLTDFQERQGRVVAVLGGRKEVSIETQCKPQGELSLAGISVSAFQLVRVPRVWDDPGRREAEKGNSEELARLAWRFKEALDEWIGSVAELGNWIRYSPPPPEGKRLEPWFEDEEEGGPETIH